MGYYPKQVLGSEKAAFGIISQWGITRNAQWASIQDWVSLHIHGACECCGVELARCCSFLYFIPNSFLQVTENNFGACSRVTPPDAEALLPFDLPVNLKRFQKSAGSAPEGSLRQNRMPLMLSGFLQFAMK